MYRHFAVGLLFGLLASNSAAQFCHDDPDLDLCDVCGDFDEMDLCSDYYMVVAKCASDEMDLCDGADTYTPISPSPAVTSSTGAPELKSVSTGSVSVTVDATAAQVKSSFENAMGKLLYDQGVGNTATEAAGMVTATVSTSTNRRLEVTNYWFFHTRRLALATYNVVWTMSVPLAAASNAQTVINSISVDSSALKNEILTQFQAAGVTSATEVTLSSFTVNTNFQGGSDSETGSAVRTTRELSTALMVLMSCLSLTFAFSSVA
jgi:hypothetical protein